MYIDRLLLREIVGAEGRAFLLQERDAASRRSRRDRTRPRRLSRRCAASSRDSARTSARPAPARGRSAGTARRNADSCASVSAAIREARADVIGDRDAVLRRAGSPAPRARPSPSCRSASTALRTRSTAPGTLTECTPSSGIDLVAAAAVVIRGRARRRDAAAVEGDGLALARVVQHDERIAAEAALHRQHHAFRGRHRDRGVERVAAALHDAEAR